MGTASPAARNKDAVRYLDDKAARSTVRSQMGQAKERHQFFTGPALEPRNYQLQTRARQAGSENIVGYTL